MLWLDELERRVSTNVLAATLAQASGAEGVEVPDWYEVRADFDRQLAAEPERGDDTQLTQLRALGLRE